ncbi:glycosyl hydrolases family 31-domain-containing protein [Tricladium varicosporioides]|nr:glycosyl hydrolases family 31-domain-containing protein [Hymenoscyphus varicosporioides]
MDAESIKRRDPYIFIKADDVFKNLDDPASGTKQPLKISCSDDDQLLGQAQNPVCKHGRIFRFDDNSLLHIQFIRPKIWRIRFNSQNSTPADFRDYNTRTLIQDTMTTLIETLDVFEQINWRVELIKDPAHQFYKLQSVLDPDDPINRRVCVELFIQRNPFKITAVRSVEVLPSPNPIPEFQINETSNGHANGNGVTRTKNTYKVVVWQTKEQALQYNNYAAVLSMEKASTAKYMGFGEQGGTHLFKDKTYMNYFNFDNMKYENIYNEGPRCDAEPLYHSEPYWIEVDGLPGYQSQVATFIDNYSHVCVDIGKKDASTLRVGTRFNTFQCIMAAGNNFKDVIYLYTSIAGGPKLKPRHILGYHQGCYGYDTQQKVVDVVDRYRQVDFPLDGMHIDVDMQDNYRTFTIDTREGKFPNPTQMFSSLRAKGVKCSTNITPYINSEPNNHYSTYNEGVQNNYFIKDRRDKDPTAPTAEQQRYLIYGNGNARLRNPNVDRPPYSHPDNYNFAEVFDSGKDFHGGVFYGWGNGNPGVYPNLNNKEVRKWWGAQYKYLFDCGLEFVWQDMTSPCMAEEYGDMKSFPFRLLLDSDGWSGDPKGQEQKKAIEIWALYSYNLHKATYHGLNYLDTRKGKRNFIIGRGSFAGSHRFAGLWTGDNSSTWDFLDISVAQVLALGLSGVTIAGADVGGFEPAPNENAFADPELVIRWYCAYSLLPWFRNHYSQKAGKQFQEPYKYEEYYQNNKDRMSEGERRIYGSVLPVCRYYIKLRYTLLQVMYDAMFENLINGLPIARTMVITDELDRSLFDDNKAYARSQYLVRNDILVAPALLKESVRNKRKVYLPYPNRWFTMNLRAENSKGVPLLPKISGGTYIDFDCHISNDDGHIPYITPMFIREGAIIPQINARDSVPDRTTNPNTPENPVTINIYPGKDNTYSMYLDDGVSRNSAPTSVYLSALPNSEADTPDGKYLSTRFGDPEAQSQFCNVVIKQKSWVTRNEDDSGIFTRRITITSPWDEYKEKVYQDIGDVYTVVIWHEVGTQLNSISVTPDTFHNTNDLKMRATIVTVPVRAAHTLKGVSFDVTHA